MSAVLDRPSPAPPDRTAAQRMDGLKRANEVRSRRAALKRDLKAGRKSVVTLLACPPDWLETCEVVDLLLATPKWGSVKVNKALSVCRISPSKQVGALTARQRAELIAWMR